MNRVLKCVIFDMDGTLVDSEKVYLAGYKNAFDKFNVAATGSELKIFTGLSGDDELNEIDKFTNDRAITEQIFEHMITYCHNEFAANRVELKADAVQLLDYCRDRCLKIGLATSSHEKNARDILTNLNIIDYFDFFVFGDEVDTPKPDPTIYRMATLRSGFERDDCLVVEDSLAGVTSATKARLSVIQIFDDVDPIYFANYNVDTLKGIIPIIDKLIPKNTFMRKKPELEV